MPDKQLIYPLGSYPVLELRRRGGLDNMKNCYGHADMSKRHSAPLPTIDYHPGLKSVSDRPKRQNKGSRRHVRHILLPRQPLAEYKGDVACQVALLRPP